MRRELLAFLGIARRAGTILIGRDAIKSGIRRGKVRFLIIAGDASKRLDRDLGVECTKYGVEWRRLKSVGKRELGMAIGRFEAAAIALTNERLAEKVKEIVR